MWSFTRVSRLCHCNASHLTAQVTCRRASTTAAVPRKRSTPTAERLYKTGLWAHPRSKAASSTEDGTEKPKRKPRATKSKASAAEKAKVKGDKTRVNIVSDELCGDITQYIGSTLNRHVGCDILDLNPGVGLWSRQLHEVLKPRSHILMEPDATLYEPFLAPLLEKPGTRLVPQSGILWKELREAMGFLEHQTEEAVDPGKDRKRNDTLIVTANLCWSPKRRYRHFDSMAVLVLFQLLSSIRYSTLFQKYGLIRMLLWVSDDDKRSFLPQCIQSRKKSALDAEFACEWIAEVAGKDPATQQTSRDELKKSYMREHSINIQSSQDTLARMADSGIKIMPHRTMAVTKEAMERGANLDKSLTVKIDAAGIKRPWMRELEDLQAAFNAGEIKEKSEEYKKLIKRRAQLGMAERNNAKSVELMEELLSMCELYPHDLEELAKRDIVFNEDVERMTKMSKGEFRLLRDNSHIFNQKPPAMLWDRRPFEPLKVEADEFFPNVECALLDIQPKSMNKLLRSVGNEADRPADILDLIQRSMLEASVAPISLALERLWPGAREGVLQHCPSLRDPAAGGLPGTGYAELTPRMLNEEQWLEILDAFMKWPFRPSYAEMVGRLSDDIEAGDGASIDTGI